MDYIMGNNPKYKLSKKARNMLLAGNLHRISRQCCVYNKEKAMEAWGKKNHRKAIMGVRGGRKPDKRRPIHILSEEKWRFLSSI